ncbi:hypothetical protein AFLA_004072 [Aspergillus flavus NRRL3357]|nr:hypothetical protein AFLA_004072 [Aspergillus flavus NRRL3357]
MCSQYFFKYDCGCTHPEGDVVYCAKRGTSCTGGLKSNWPGDCGTSTVAFRYVLPEARRAQFLSILQHYDIRNPPQILYF